jgi:hypothetical protein
MSESIGHADAGGKSHFETRRIVRGLVPAILSSRSSAES